jgi:hypothetical protein
MGSRETGIAAPEPVRRHRRRWLPVLALGVAALLYTAVWQLPALVSNRANVGTLLLSRVEGGEWVELQDGVEVPALARIRFEVKLSQAASVVLVGLNAEGRATLYMPSSGSLRLPAGTSILGEQGLDGVGGLEVFLAELCNTPLSPVVILKAGERAAAAAGEPNALKTLDLGCPEARFSLRKEAAR